MIQINPVTGRPVEENPGISKFIEEDKLHRQAGKADNIKQILDSPQGDFFVSQVKEQLMARIDVLILQDEESKGLIKLLARMGMVISLGEIASQKLINKLLKK